MKPIVMENRVIGIKGSTPTKEMDEGIVHRKDMELISDVHVPEDQVPEEIRNKLINEQQIHDAIVEARPNPVDEQQIPEGYQPAEAEVLQLFSIPFLRGQLNLDTDEIAQSCRDLLSEVEQGDVGQEYTTYFNEDARIKMHDTEWFKDFSNKIKDSYITFIANMFQTPVAHLSRNDIHLFAWVNRYTGPHQHSSHNHVNSHISGTYYVKTEKSDQPIKFYSPNLMSNANHLAVDRGMQKEGFPNMVFEGVAGVDSSIQVHPIDDEFLFWPSYILHSVEPTHSFIEDYERISISFNLKYRDRIDKNLTGNDMSYSFMEEDTEHNRG